MECIHSSFQPVLKLNLLNNPMRHSAVVHSGISNIYSVKLVHSFHTDRIG